MAQPSLRQRHDGACYAYSKADGSCYALPRSEYARFVAEWMAGRAFWIGHSFYGATITIKLGDIVAVTDNDAASLAAGRADRTEDQREDALV